MKSKLTRKLTVYFLIVIFLFSLVSGSLFVILGRQNMERTSVEYLESRAERTASFISNVLVSESAEDSSDSEGNRQGMGKMTSSQRQMRHTPGKNYLKWMNELLETDIRLISKDGKAIESGIDKAPIQYESLNESEKEIVTAAFHGEVSSTHESSFLDQKTSVSVAAPIVVNGEVVSALLFNEQNDMPGEFLKTAGTIFLISILSGAALVVLLGIYFARRFVQPLNTLSEATEKLILGDYDVHTGIQQDDEVGDLARCVDALAMRLDEAQRETEAMNDMRDDFISSMSHELKTPVTVLKASIEALKAGVVSGQEDVQNYYTILYEEIGVLEKLINDLMELNILQNSKFEVHKEEVNLLDTLNDAMRSQSPLAREKNILLTKDFEEPVAFYHGDYTRLRQLFITILNNGVKYADSGTDINVQAKKVGTSWLISIRNQGETMSEETLQHLFDPFYRDKNTLKKGFGLGLAIANEIAQQHGIKLWADSIKGQTTFYLDFPQGD